MGVFEGSTVGVFEGSTVGVFEGRTAGVFEGSKVKGANQLNVAVALLMAAECALAIQLDRECF